MLCRLIGGFLVLVPSTPAVPLTQESVLLRLKPKTGAVYVYDTTTETSLSGSGEPRVEKSATTITTKVLSSSALAVKLQTTLSRLKGSDSELQALKTLKMTTTISPHYKVLAVKSTGGGSAGAQIAKGMEMSLKLSPQYPSKPLRVNDWWPIVIDVKEMFAALGSNGIKFIGDSKLRLRSTLGRLERRGSKILAHLRMTGTDKLAFEGRKQRVDMDFTMDGTLIIDVATGMYVSSQLLINEKMTTPSGPMLMKITTRLTLAKGP